MNPVALRRPDLPRGSAAALVAALTVLTAAASLLRLGTRSIWGDEAISISYALTSLGGLHRAVARDPNMSLYYGLLWVWAHVFGDGLVALRSLSFLFAALTIPAVYAIGRRIANVRAGLIAAILLATNAFFLRYAQEARGYSLVLLLVTLSMLAFLAALSDGTRASHVGYVATTALAFYAHYFAAYVIAVQVIVLLVARRRKALDRSWVLSYAAIGLLTAPMLYKAGKAGSGQISWVPRPGWHALETAARSLAGESLGLLVALLLIIGLGAIAKARDGGVPAAWGMLFLWLVLPLVASFAVSQAKPMFLARYLIVSLPAVALLAAVVISAARPLFGALALTILLALSVPSLVDWYQRPAVTDWKGMGRYLQRVARPGDRVVYEISAGAPAIAFYERHGQAPQLDRVPTAQLISSRSRRLWLVQWQGVEELERRLRQHGFVRIGGRNFHGSVQAELYQQRSQRS